MNKAKKQILHYIILWGFVWLFFVFKPQILPYIVPAENPSVLYSGWSYTTYAVWSLPGTWDVVLFFHADRCPSCVRAEKSILKSWIPAWLHISKVDYDTHKELRERYGIRSQTSYVHIDPEGKAIRTRIGSMNIASILDQLET